jgi:hypothetical protein
MNKMLALLGFLLCLAHPLPGAEEPSSPQLPPKEKFHLFLLAGQSNMAGRGKPDPLSHMPHPRVFALRRDFLWMPAVDPLHWDKPAAGTGLGKPFAETLAERFPDTSVGLIPAACGGSPVSAWKPGVFFEQTKSHPWDDAVARTRKSMQNGTLKAILWHQGESDANDKNAPDYEKNLEELIHRFRAEFQSPELPFLIGQLGKFPGKPWPAATSTIDAAHQSLAHRLKNVRFIPIPDPGSIGDRLHFDTATLRSIGKSYAEAYLNLTEKTAP